jgi:hypothetical protein
MIYIPYFFKKKGTKGELIKDKISIRVLTQLDDKNM